MTGMLSTSSIPLSFAYASRGSAGRLSLPVSPGQLLYSNFQHVSGVAAAPGEAVATIDRLKILDVLIESLSSMKTEPLAAAEKPSGLSNERLDAPIQQYGSELRSSAAAPVPPYAFTAPGESGIPSNLAS